MVDVLMWIQTLMVGVNTVALLLVASTWLKWVTSNEKTRRF